MRLPKLLTGLLLAAILFAPVLAADDERSAVPGMINYVEGHAAIGSETLNSKSIGSAQLQANQTLTTENGKVEVLLTPGVFLRVGSNSSVTMVSPSITNTDVRLNQGEAMVEVAELHPQNDINITAGGASAKLVKTGLYDFDLGQSQLRVYDGNASVLEGDQQVEVKGGKQLSLNATGKLKAEKFDRKEYEESDLYRWSSLRSAYLAEANVNAAALYAQNGWGPWGPGWWGADWYWNPWFGAYTFIPGDGIFYSPFGWGFYSPWWVYQAPYYGYWYGYGFGHPYYHHFTADVRDWGPGDHYVGSPNYAHGVYSGPGSTGEGGFRSGPRIPSGGFGRPGGGLPSGGFDGGGFHGGGFHGGVGFSGGGGFHGR
jgi:hypothetical protein